MSLRIPRITHTHSLGLIFFFVFVSASPLHTDREHRKQKTEHREQTTEHKRERGQKKKPKTKDPEKKRRKNANKDRGFTGG